MQSLSQNVYDEVLQVWIGNTDHDDFNVGCELFEQSYIDSLLTSGDN